jgi:hypothetical protein
VTICGGKIRTDELGHEYFAIPVQSPRPSRLEQCWDPRPADNVRYSKQEMAKITALLGKDMSEAIEKFAPGWKITQCGEEMDPGLREELRGRKNVLVTHPLNPEIGCVISRTVKLPINEDTTLKLVVGHDPRGDWDLIVKVDGKEILRKTIGPKTTTVGWTDVNVDLSRYAGRSVKIELVNEPTDWRYEAGYWAEITLSNN